MRHRNNDRDGLDRRMQRITRRTFRTESMYPRLVGILPLLYTRSAPVDQWVAHATTEEEMQ